MKENPHGIFTEWATEARASEINDPNAMALATTTPDNQPSVRMVLLKGHDERGFVWYTNLESRKAGELLATEKAALLFHWKSLRRQVRIEGPVSRVSDKEGDAYFATRSRDAQLGAWASEQSRPLDSRPTLEARYEELRARFEGQDVSRPPHWSGFRLDPRRIEFWQDGEHRLHHRRVFTRTADGWDQGLLYP